jgi:hypothetical protein
VQGGSSAGTPLTSEPVSEILYRDLLRIEYRAGNQAAVREAADKPAAPAASLEVELDEETSTLVSSLLGGRRGEPLNGLGFH